MKRTARIVMAVVIGLAFMASAGFAAESKYSGFLGDYYKDLGPGPKGGVKERWLKPGVDFSKYHKVMIDTPDFYYAADSPDKGIDVAQITELTNDLNQALINALKDKYPSSRNRDLT